MKAVLQYRASPGLQQRIAALSFPTVIVDETDKDTFRREMRDAEILLHVLEPVTAAVIDAAPRLRLIQKIGIGVNTIDLEAATRRGISVCNMPGTNTQAVAEMTLLLMLATLRRLAQLDALTRSGKGWEFERELPDDLGELAGRRVGLIGFGAVARRLVPMLQAIGADVLYTSRRAIPDVTATIPAVSRNLGRRRRTVAALAADPGDDRNNRGSSTVRAEARQCPDQYRARPSRRRGCSARRFGERASLRRWPRCLFARACSGGRPVAAAAEYRRCTASRVAHGRNARAQPRRHRRKLPPPVRRRTAVAPGRLTQNRPFELSDVD